MAQQVESLAGAVALSGNAFRVMGTAARAAFALHVRFAEDADGLADRLSAMDDNEIAAFREDLEIAAHNLRWAAELCDTAREFVDCALSAND